MATIQDPAATTGTASKYILSTYYDKVMLARLTPELRWYQAAEKKRLPQHSGKIIKFSSFRKLALGTKLTEGTKPTPKVLSAYNVTATLGQFGDYVAVTDLMEVTGITSTVEEAVGVMGEHCAYTLDYQIKRASWGGGLPSTTSNLSASLRARHTGSVSTFSAFNGLVGGFTIRLTRQCSALLAATGRMSTAAVHAASAYNAATKTTLKDIREAVAQLRGRDVKPKEGGYFIGIGHPNALSDLMCDTATGGWIDWQKYTSADPMYKGEVGRAEGVKFVSTTNAMDRAFQRGSLISATCLTIMGQGALGVVDFENNLDGEGKNYVIIKKSNQYDSSDPLNQIAGTVGWKTTFAAVVLNTSCGIHVMGLRN
jgi:N4-gp56 family major capsid protein